MATDAIFKKWGFRNPDGILADLNITSISFSSTGTFRPQHRKLMSRVDTYLKQKIYQPAESMAASTFKNYTTVQYSRAALDQSSSQRQQ